MAHRRGRDLVVLHEGHVAGGERLVADRERSQRADAQGMGEDPEGPRELGVSVRAVVPALLEHHGNDAATCAARRKRNARILAPDGTTATRRAEPAFGRARQGHCGPSGGGGIRTRGPRERTPVFKTGAFDRSATPPDAASVTARVRGARAMGMMRARWRSRGRATPTCRPGASPGRSRAGRSTGRTLGGCAAPGLRGRRHGGAAIVAGFGLLLGSLPDGPPLVAVLRRRRRRARLLLALRAHDVARRAAALRGGPRGPGRAPGAAPRRPRRGHRHGRGRARGRPACARSPTTCGGASATTRAAA